MALWESLNVKTFIPNFGDDYNNNVLIFMCKIVQFVCIFNLYVFLLDNTKKKTFFFINVW